MKIVIPGGSGHLGTLLARSFHKAGDDVAVLSRTPSNALWRTVLWDGEKLGKWADELEGADVVINLAGQTVNCRYTPENRKIITDSRMKSTKVIGEAIARAWNPPRVWLQASTATIYAHTFGPAHDEVSGVIGGSETNAPDTWRFSIGVATSWERALRESATPNTRRVAMRTAIVMHPAHGSPFDILMRLVRFGLGGQAGNGRQYVSWIHQRDFVNAVKWLIDHDELEGPVNLCSPNPVTNADFMRVLRTTWGAPFGLPAAEWTLELGAFLLGSETELILKSRRVVPTKLLQSGFVFAFPSWPDAARDLCKRMRQTKSDLCSEGDCLHTEPECLFEALKNKLESE